MDNIYDNIVNGGLPVIYSVDNIYMTVLQVTYNLIVDYISEKEYLEIKKI